MDSNTVKFGSATISTETNLKSVKDKNLRLGIRSEYVRLMKSKGKNTVQAIIENVDDWGNHKLISANFEGNSIKVKVKREVEVPAEKVFLKLPTKNCCVYENELLIS
jgi:glycerol transport system ATP-binding protein